MADWSKLQMMNWSKLRMASWSRRRRLDPVRIATGQIKTAGQSNARRGKRPAPPCPRGAAAAAAAAVAMTRRKRAAGARGACPPRRCVGGAGVERLQRGLHFCSFPARLQRTSEAAKGRMRLSPAGVLEIRNSSSCRNACVSTARRQKTSEAEPALGRPGRVRRRVSGDAADAGAPP